MLQRWLSRWFATPKLVSFVVVIKWLIRKGSLLITRFGGDQADRAKRVNRLLAYLNDKRAGLFPPIPSASVRESCPIDLTINNRNLQVAVKHIHGQREDRISSETLILISTKYNLNRFLGLRTTREKGLQIDCVSIEMSVKVHVVRSCTHACQTTVGTNTPRSNGGAMNPCTKDLVRHWKRTSSLVICNSLEIRHDRS